jgi:hypothetical protein
VTEAELPTHGHVADRSDPIRLSAALLAAVDYRGDVTLILTDETSMEGYLFNLNGEPETGSFELMIKSQDSPLQIEANTIQAIDFTGRDTAEGKSFDTWIQKYVAKKMAGEQASIECESLDE